MTMEFFYLVRSAVGFKLKPVYTSLAFTVTSIEVGHYQL